MTTPLYICTGFLDSGKTKFVKETLMEQEWIEFGLTLLILCEEGEEDYPANYLKSQNIVLLKIEDFSQLNAAFFENCQRHYRPAQVVIEYNGMWKLQELLMIRYPRNWELQGVYSTVNGMTLDMYLKNMRNMLMEQLTESELIVINRCPKDMSRQNFRRALKVQNPMAQLIFEGLDGHIIQPSAEDLPYDVSKDTIVIDDDDFGIWYVDANEHPNLYLGKEIEFKAQIMRPKGMSDSMFVPVRKIMTCCADDIRYYGYPCKTLHKIALPKNAWMTLRVRFDFERQPLLHLIDMQPTEKPEEEVVYLG